MTVRIIIGDALTELRKMDGESIDCVVTSPPYWGLRDYGVKGQMGLEPSLGEHIENMVGVFDEVRRVLKETGTCWVNYGDCYATTRNGRSAADTKNLSGDDRTFRDKPFSTIGPINVGTLSKVSEVAGGTDPKNLKKGVRRIRPSSGGTLKPKDLCLMPHRFAIAMQEAGWWVRSDITWGKPNAMPDSSGRYRPSAASERIFMFHKKTPYYDAEAVRMPPAPGSAARAERANTGTHVPGQPPHRGIAGPREAKQKMPDNWDTESGAHGSYHRKGREKGKDKQRGHSRRHAGFNDRWDDMTKAEQQANGRLLRNYEPDLTPICGQEVWDIPTAAFSEAHFATFPPALVVPCIKAGCPEGGIVLDPFGGAGTTALVADRLGRDAILIELNPEYAELAKRRIEKDAGMFARVAP